MSLSIKQSHFIDLTFTSKFWWISDGLRDISPHMKDILKGLREFKRSSAVAFEMLKVFSEGSESSAVSLLFCRKI
ncbi:hypothetical protein Hanom_Chr09g00763961 [Helianthus anomalus]